MHTLPAVRSILQIINDCCPQTLTTALLIIILREGNKNRISFYGANVLCFVALTHSILYSNTSPDVNILFKEKFEFQF